ncbi:thiamine pyrophosphate-binding protein [Microtetraspora sp. AC03309]|uniref:thiamine pyrophosphate-binding protein n=1 Tax=Microtetraspora sp. AC03309 TaxID=2779376 RepID=UPI001E5976F5|nr:thiamine pyrophosphate-binding protein [Microtetraspora sp. AC03309]MCC5580373.1 thiamine pyrophosphate-binding protein [Microtetraspora sp. AC03309]
MNVAEAVGAILASLGVDTAFGVVGSGNFHVTNSLTEHGVRFVAARHEGGAATMADAYARMSGTVAVLSVHQGPGLTNALTGVAEAAKSRTPLLVLAGEATSPRSNFRIDQPGLVAAVGALAARVGSAETVVEDTVLAFLTALLGRRTVLLNLPIEVQDAELPDDVAQAVRELRSSRITDAGEQGSRAWAAVRDLRDRARRDLADEQREADAAEPSASEVPGSAPADSVSELIELLATARRPVFVAGRGARGARREIEALADRVGALLATSAVARGLFRGSQWDLDVSGGFASPLAAELIAGADVVVGWGCALNMWTTRHGSLIGPDTKVVQVDLDPDAVGAHRPVHLGVIGDVAETARAVTQAIGEPRDGYRGAELATRIAAEIRWRDVPYEDRSGNGRIDPRTLTIELDDLLPAERIISVDSGNFMGYPSMFLSVPDENGFCFTQAFQSVGLGLATAVGAALARPDRLPVAALGDGGALMGVAELETVVRLGLPMVIVIYDDEAYGAEVHHFGPDGHALDTVTFPAVDIGAIARGFGCDAVTVRERADLAGVAEWLKGPRDKALVVHAKVTGDRGSWWLEEAFRGH